MRNPRNINTSVPPPVSQTRPGDVDPRITAALGLDASATVEDVVGAIERLQDDCGHLKLAAHDACKLGLAWGGLMPLDDAAQGVNKLIDTCLARKDHPHA